MHFYLGISDHTSESELNTWLLVINRLKEFNYSISSRQTNFIE